MSTNTTEEIKPYKGELRNIHILTLTTDGSAYKPECYGDNLGYIMQVDFVNHPNFRGLNALGGTTSLIVSYNRKTGEVESLNSRYKVIKDE